jgi:acyl carrier protein
MLEGLHAGRFARWQICTLADLHAGRAALHHRKGFIRMETLIERFIVEDLLAGKRSHLDPDERFIETGLLDSLTLLQLIAFVEEEFHIQVQDDEMVLENFGSIDAITAFLKSKLGEHSQQAAR